MRTKLIAAAMSGGLLVSAGLAAGMPGTSYADTTPAPPANADAVAVKVATILSISHTHATADKTGAKSSATANVLEVLGSVPGGLAQLGGTQTGPGNKAGSLLDTTASPLTPLSAVLNLQVFPWKATVTDTGTHRHAEAFAAVATLVLMNDKTLFVKLLQSKSAADHDDTTLESSSSAVSDGAIIGVGGALTVDLLHSEASSKDGGSSYLVDINGTKIGTNDQAKMIPLCSLAVPSVLALNCLSTTGGKGTNNSATDLTAVLGSNTATAGLLNTSSSTGKGTSVQGATTPTTAAPAPVVQAAQLPRTGVGSLAIALYGALLVALGAAAVLAARARRRLHLG